MKTVDVALILGVSIGSAYDSLWKTGLASAIVVGKVVRGTRWPLVFMLNINGILNRSIKL